MGHLEIGIKIAETLVRTVGMTATGTGSMHGRRALLKGEEVKRVLAIIKGRFLWSASLSFVDLFIFDDSFFFRLTSIRYDFPECSIEGLTFSPNVVCCPEGGKTEIMSDLRDILSVEVSEQLDEMVRQDS